MKNDYHARLMAADKDGIKAIVGEMREAGVLNSYLKTIMVFPGHKESDTGSVGLELVRILPFIDPNHEISGGPMLASAAYHSSYDLGDRDKQHLAMKLLVQSGADPNAQFHATVAMEDARPMDIFSMVVLPEIGRPPAGHQLSALLAMMCGQGLTLEAPEGELSKLQQLVLKMGPELVLEKAHLEERKAAVRANGQKELLQCSPLLHDAGAMLTEQAEDLVNVLVDFGAKQDRRFPAMPHAECVGTAALEGKTPLEAVRFYKDLFAKGMHDPEMLKQYLAPAKASWDTPEYDFKETTLMDAYRFYAKLEKQMLLKQHARPGYGADRALGLG